MAEGTIPGKGFIVIVLVFVALVVVIIRWGDESATNGTAGPVVASIRIAEKDGMVEVSPGTSTTAEDMVALLQGRMARLLSGSDDERRAAAVEMASLAGSPGGRDRLTQIPANMLAEIRRALLGRVRTGTGLNDADPLVSSSCRDALVGMWRISHSAVCDDYLRDGLAALDADDADAALNAFVMANGLGEAAPPDLYRLLAEAYLAKDRPNDALEACRRALSADDTQFPALLAMARAYVQLREFDNANKALTVALSIYPGFAEAKTLRAEIQAQTRAPTVP